MVSEFALGFFISFSSAVAFSISNILVKKGAGGENVFSSIFITMLSSELLVFIVSLVTGEFFDIGEMSLKAILIYALTGLVGFTFGRTLNYYSIVKVGPSTTSAVISARTLFALIFSIFLTSDILTGLDVLGDVVVTVGIVIVSIDRRLKKSFPGSYMIFPLIASIVLGLGDVLIRVSGLLSDFPIDGSLIAYSVGILSYLPIKGRGISGIFRAIPLRKLQYLLLAGISSGFAQVFRYTGLALVPIFIAVPLISLAPIVTVLLSFVLLKDEKINVKFVAGVVVSVIGVFLLNDSFFFGL